jgi:hypothetical protein
MARREHETMGEEIPSGWLELALSRPVVRRALKYAVLVGAVLITINHGDALLHGELGARRLLKMSLTVLVPYMVSTLSSVEALRSPRR